MADTATKKDTVAAVRKDLNSALEQVASLESTVKDLVTYANQLHTFVSNLTTASGNAPRTQRPTHSQVQAEALNGMKAVTSDPRVTEWCDKALARIEQGHAFGRDSNVWKVVGRRQSTPEERIGRLIASAQPTGQQAQATQTITALPPKPPSMGGDEHDESDDAPAPTEAPEPADDDEVPFD